MRDLDELTAALARSRFRRSFKLGPKERDYLVEKGPEIVLEHVRTFIAQRLAPAAPRNDGKQTPWRGHPVFVAQHATATCCRGCLAKWHGIERGHELSAIEQNHVLAVIARWLEAELGRNVIALGREVDNRGTDENKNLRKRTLAAKRD